MAGYRNEKDSMGSMKVPKDALYGASTQRAYENFEISGRGIPKELIRALGLVKLAAAQVNERVGSLPKELAKPIQKAAQEVADNKHDAEFIVDVFQTGSGTSSNMNANEVIANRAIQLAGGKIGDKSIHANDHVNLGQSSNDVFPTAIHIATLEKVQELLLAFEDLEALLVRKSEEFHSVLKVGRTHLQDATPIRLGQEFSGYASQMGHALDHVRSTLPHLRELAIGGTAVGTGLNAPEDFGALMAEKLASLTGLEVKEATNHFEAQAARDALVALSGSLRGAAIVLLKIANDVRMLGMGPRCGLAELKLPEVQPGSSIMPGKVNPVICESVIQVSAQVQANDVAVALGGQWGQLELNTMMPLMARNILESVSLLTRGARVFADKCLVELRADEERCSSLVEQSLAMVTSLAPLIGYDRAAEVAKEASTTGQTIREVMHAKNLVSTEELELALDPERMVGN